MFSGSLFFFPLPQDELKSKRGEKKQKGGWFTLQKEMPSISLFLKTQAINLYRILKLSQQVETRKAGEKPSFSG